MQADSPSATASYVAMGRAMAHARGNIRGYSDPFALGLLTDEYRAATERCIRGEWPRSVRELLLRQVARTTEKLMGPRTAEIDDGLRGLPPGCQVVLLGAGLDARAYRMTELAQSVAFEVDYPSTQAFKRRQTEGLRPVTRELKYVPVDFANERMQDALARAGHRRDEPTAWVFEGVISYLLPRDVEATFRAIAECSAPRSRLLATYNEPSRGRRLFDLVTGLTRRTGEPHHAWYRPEEMRDLLAAHGFVVCSDRDGLERSRRWAPSPDRRGLFRFHHVVIADWMGARSSPRRTS
jgi:methyltransferase (TIGR00027 family)